MAVSYRQSAPKRWACRRMRSMRSGPLTPSGKPGKLSTSVVQVSWPPGSFPPGRAARGWPWRRRWPRSGPRSPTRPRSRRDAASLPRRGDGGAVRGTTRRPTARHYRHPPPKLQSVPPGAPAPKPDQMGSSRAGKGPEIGRTEAPPAPDWVRSVARRGDPLGSRVGGKWAGISPPESPSPHWVRLGRGGPGGKGPSRLPRRPMTSFRAGKIGFGGFVSSRATRAGLASFRAPRRPGGMASREFRVLGTSPDELIDHGHLRSPHLAEQHSRARPGQRPSAHTNGDPIPKDRDRANFLRGFLPQARRNFDREFLGRTASQLPARSRDRGPGRDRIEST